MTETNKRNREQTTFTIMIVGDDVQDGDHMILSYKENSENSGTSSSDGLCNTKGGKFKKPSYYQRTNKRSWSNNLNNNFKQGR